MARYVLPRPVRTRHHRHHKLMDFVVITWQGWVHLFPSILKGVITSIQDSCSSIASSTRTIFGQLSLKIPIMKNSAETCLQNTLSEEYRWQEAIKTAITFAFIKEAHSWTNVFSLFVHQNGLQSSYIILHTSKHTFLLNFSMTVLRN